MVLEVVDLEVCDVAVIADLGSRRDIRARAEHEWNRTAATE
jgi:hypothetical protein